MILVSGSVSRPDVIRELGDSTPMLKKPVGRYLPRRRDRPGCKPPLRCWRRRYGTGNWPAEMLKMDYKTFLYHLKRLGIAGKKDATKQIVDN